MYVRTCASISQIKWAFGNLSTDRVQPEEGDKTGGTVNRVRRVRERVEVEEGSGSLFWGQSADEREVRDKECCEQDEAEDEDDGDP